MKAASSVSEDVCYSSRTQMSCVRKNLFSSTWTSLYQWQKPCQLPGLSLDTQADRTRLLPFVTGLSQRSGMEWTHWSHLPRPLGTGHNSGQPWVNSAWAFAQACGNYTWWQSHWLRAEVTCRNAKWAQGVLFFFHDVLNCMIAVYVLVELSHQIVSPVQTEAVCFIQLCTH